MVARDPSRPHVLVAYERLLREEGSTSVCAAAIQALTEDIARSSRSYATSTCGRDGSRAMIGGPGWPRCTGVLGVDMAAGVS